MTIEFERQPSLADAARLLEVPLSDLDAHFGVLPIDPDCDLYAVRVAAGSLPKGRGGKYRGPFSDPKIAPMR